MTYSLSIVIYWRSFKKISGYHTRRLATDKVIRVRNLRMSGEKREFTKEKSSVIEVPVKNLPTSFVTEFFRYCEMLDVYPIPKFLIKGDAVYRQTAEHYSEIKVTAAVPEAENEQLEEECPVFTLTYGDPVKLEDLQEIRSKGQEVSYCVLISLYQAMNVYRTITNLSLPDCQLDSYGAVQIAEMLKEFGCITDLNLDRNPDIREKCYMLCSPSGSLKFLSLQLCAIGDAEVMKIAKKLTYRDPPRDPKLITLNLANNNISKVGAGHLANMLRSNRSLRSLVLSGNRIRDSGALLIIHELCMSLLTHDEIMELRRRRFAELKREDGGNVSETGVRHPFMSEIMTVEDSVSCSGNFCLQHLNLSFNRLTNATVKALVSCLRYQALVNANDLSKGLLYVFLEGNNFRQEDNKDWLRLLEIMNSRKNGKPINIQNRSSP